MHLRDLLSRLNSDMLAEADGFLAHCPAHDDTRQSLRVTVSDRGRVLVKCRAGCATAAVMKSVGLSMADLATMRGDGVEGIAPATSTDALPDADALAEAEAFVAEAAAALGELTPAADEVREMLASRFGIDEATAARLRLGVTVDRSGEVRAVVPFLTPSGDVVGWQARAVSRDAAIRWTGPRNPAGASWSKLAHFAGHGGWAEVIVTEGPGDALAIAAVGYDAIAIRGAALAASTALQADLSEWIGDRPVVLAGDGDPAGQTFNDRLAAALTERGHAVSVLDMPEGADVSDLREREPVAFATDLVKAVAAAPPVSVVPAPSRFAVDRDLDKFPLSDLGNARWTLARIRDSGSDVRYVPERGRFVVLEEGIWRVDLLQRVRTEVQNAAVAMMKYARERADSTNGPRLAKWATYSQSSNGIRAALTELEALEGVATPFDDFDGHEHLIAARNGVIDLRTGQLRPHDPALLLTKRVDLDYDPSARSELWEKFLTDIFPDNPDLPAYMQRLLGYGITGSTAEQCFAVFWGQGANGKSTLTDTLSDIFGDFTTNTPFATFEAKRGDSIPNDIAALKGARLILASEGDHGRPMAEATLKRMSGGDKVAARFMRQEFFEFTPEGLIVLTTNNKPEFRGQDEGLWRRVKMIPFTRYFAPDERDHRLKSKLTSEEHATAILAWAVQGAREWYEGGLRDVESIVDATREYRVVSDKLAGFIGGEYVIDRDSEARLKAADILADYREWAHNEGYQDAEIWRRNTFYAALEERGAVKHANVRVGNSVGVAFSGIRKARPSDRENLTT